MLGEFIKSFNVSATQADESELEKNNKTGLYNSTIARNNESENF